MGRLIALGELDPPMLQKIRVRNLHHIRRSPRQLLRLNQKITVEKNNRRSVSFCSTRSAHAKGILCKKRIRPRWATSRFGLRRFLSRWADLHERFVWIKRWSCFRIQSSRGSSFSEFFQFGRQLFRCLNTTSAQFPRIGFSAARSAATCDFKLTYVPNASDVVLFPAFWPNRIIESLVFARCSDKEFALLHELATLFHAIFSSGVSTTIIPIPLYLAIDVVTPVSQPNKSILRRKRCPRTKYERGCNQNPSSCHSCSSWLTGRGFDKNLSTSSL
jgi:hypothetical protein